uniref:Uncharacterized protein n=1 Tax=Anguilla anguilla TaxID=7936 RepID=A0A0E9UVC4_ANGAN
MLGVLSRAPCLPFMMLHSNLKADYVDAAIHV